MSIKNLINFKNIKKSNLTYILVWIFYYAWVIVFTTWWTSSPVTVAVFDAEMRAMLHIINLTASAVFIFILKREWYVVSSRISAVFLIVSSVIFLTIQNDTAQTVAAIVLAVAIGGLNASILIPFVFVLNNTEKFYSVVFSNLLISVMILLQEFGTLKVTDSIIFSLIMLALSILPTIFFKKSDLLESYPKNLSLVPKYSKITYLTIALNCVYAIMCKSVGKIFLQNADMQTAIALEPYFYFGAILGCVVYFLIYMVFRNSNQTTWNVTFSTFVAAMLLYSFGNNSNVVLGFFAVLLGVGSTMGMINMYYILGVIGKKYFSIKYVRLSILFIGTCGGVSGILIALLTKQSPITAGMALAGFSAIAIVILLMFSPTLTQKYFCDSWASDSEKSDVNTSLNYLQKYNLSKRESEICQLLLQGNTLRQAAAILDISYATVNTYTTTLYRKLNINSRTELLILFKDYIVEPVN